MRTKLAATLVGIASLLAAPAALANVDLSPVQDWDCNGAINSYDLFLYETEIWQFGMSPWPLDYMGNPIYDPTSHCIICHIGATQPREKYVEQNEFLLPFGAAKPPKCVSLTD